MVAVDVTNPLLGPNGATAVYGPQKGASPSQLRVLEQGLERYWSLQLIIAIHHHHRHRFPGHSISDIWNTSAWCANDIESSVGAGAGGGLGGGLVAFLGAKLVSGFELVCDVVDLDEALRTSDVVITGEGALDASSTAGKVPFAIAKQCLRDNKPLIVLAGAVPTSGEHLEKVCALT